MNPVSSQNTNRAMTLSLRTTTEHRAHEREQRDVKPAGLRMALEVLRRVDDDQRADAGDEHREQQAQAIEPERERQIQARRPWHHCCEWTVGADHAIQVDEVCG